MPDIRVSYKEVVTHLRELGNVLRPALTAQYEAPPGSVIVPTAGGIKNPTLEIVSDDRRMALSDEINAVDRTLRQVAAMLEPHYTDLSRALARWEGHEGE